MANKIVAGKIVAGKIVAGKIVAGKIVAGKIVAGFNGTEASSEAVRWAADEARARSVALRVVSCFEFAPVSAESGFGAGEASAAIRSGAETNAAAIQASVSDSHPDIELTVDVASGSPAMALLKGLEPDDLVVVGASSHEGIALFWVGSTPLHLVHHSPCPVVVVRGAASRGAPDRVVVGIDGSPASEQALRWAGDEADRHGVELAVVHAWDYPYTSSAAGWMQVRDLTEVDAACTLDSAVETVRERCAAVVTPVLIESRPVDALLDTARDGDLLVLGSRGRGAIRSRIFGSTANSVLAAAAVPVVIIRADSDERQAPSGKRESAVATAW